MLEVLRWDDIIVGALDVVFTTVDAKVPAFDVVAIAAGIVYFVPVNNVDVFSLFARHKDICIGFCSPNILTLVFFFRVQ